MFLHPEQIIRKAAPIPTAYFTGDSPVIIDIGQCLPGASPVHRALADVAESLLAAMVNRYSLVPHWMIRVPMARIHTGP
jgi:hypothetical protein